MQIEHGVATWRRPWHTSGRFAFSPINIASHKRRSAIDTDYLWAAFDSLSNRHKLRSGHALTGH